MQLDKSWVLVPAVWTDCTSQMRQMLDENTETILRGPEPRTPYYQLTALTIRLVWLPLVHSTSG